MFKTALLQYVGIFQFNSCMLSETESVCVFFFCSFIWFVIRLRLFAIITTMHIPIIWHAFHFNPHVVSTRIRLIVFEYVCLGTCECVCVSECVFVWLWQCTQKKEIYFLPVNVCVHEILNSSACDLCYFPYSSSVKISSSMYPCMQMLFFWKRHSEKHE